jgi:hypothetical protein
VRVNRGAVAAEKMERALSLVWLVRDVYHDAVSERDCLTKRTLVYPSSFIFHGTGQERLDYCCIQLSESQAYQAHRRLHQLSTAFIRPGAEYRYILSRGVGSSGAEVETGSKYGLFEEVSQWAVAKRTR